MAMMRLVATEEAWSIPELARELRKVGEGPSQSLDKLGIDNVMWAIDYPFQPMEPGVQFIEQFECTGGGRHALCHGNADRMHHMAPPQ